MCVLLSLLSYALFCVCVLCVLFGESAASAVDKVVVDNERHILYVLSQPNASIQVRWWLLDFLQL